MAVRNSDDSKALWDEAARISRIEQQDSLRSLHPHHSSATNHEMRRIQVRVHAFYSQAIQMRSLFRIFVVWQVVAELLSSFMPVRVYTRTQARRSRLLQVLQ